MRIVFYILGVDYQKLLEMTFFILSNTFLEVLKFRLFRKKILDTLGDALTNRSYSLCSEL
jgi:hypothetical protein